MELDFAAPLVYFFRDRDWPKKLLVASLLTYTLVGAAPMLGWTIAIARRVAKNEAPAVPEWKDWKLFWKLGGQFALINVLWLLPLLGAVLVLYGVPALLVRTVPDEVVLLGFGGTLLCVLAFLLVYSLVYAFFLPVMMSVLAGGATTADGANPLRLWRAARLHLGGYALVFVIVGVALFNLALLLAAATLFLLLPPLLVCLGLVTAHFAGQLARPSGDENDSSAEEARPA